jgi:hypothetical protein
MRVAEIVSLGSILVMAGCGPGGPDSTEIEGRWTGELVSGYLPSGSSRVVVDVELARVGEPVMATVVFGEGEAPAPPTDPDVGWPAGIDPQGAGVPVADGFVYPSLDGTRTGDRIRVDIAVTDLWEPWCALQTPELIADGSDEAQCLPNRPWTTSPFECHLEADAENPDMLVDCLKLTLCRRTRVCACTGTDGCSPSRTGLTMELDLSVTGDTADATILWTSEDRDVGNQSARVHFTRG